MRSMDRFSVAAVAVGALLGSTPAGAFHADELPLLASHTTSEPGWMSFAVETDGAPVAFDLSIEGVKGASRMTIAQYRADGSFRQAVSLANYPDKDGTLIQVETEVFSHRGDSINRVSSSTGRNAIGTRLNHPSYPSLIGTERVLFWWAGTGTWTLAVRGSQGVGMVGSDGGDRAFFMRSHDLAGTANLQAWGHQPAATYRVGYGARAQIGTSTTFEVQDTLLLAWESGIMSADVATLVTPDGTRICNLDEFGGPPPTGIVSDGSCSLHDMKGPDSAGQGRYTFQVSGVGAIDDFYGDVWVAGVDARLA